jgi:predicted RNase H-like nuclease (RuvC/YqgF family)
VSSGDSIELLNKLDALQKENAALLAQLAAIPSPDTGGASDRAHAAAATAGVDEARPSKLEAQVRRLSAQKQEAEEAEEEAQREKRKAEREGRRKDTKIEQLESDLALANKSVGRLRERMKRFEDAEI